MACKQTTYNDVPMLLLQNDKVTLGFGRSKAQLIVEHIEDVKAFLLSTEKPKTEDK